MHPILFHIGPLTVRSYGLMIALGLLAAMELAKWGARHRQIDPQFIMDMSIVMVISGLAASRLMYVLFNRTYYLEHPWEILMVWQGGVVFYGAVLGAVPAGVYFARRRRVSVGDTMDVVAPAGALMQGIGRWGCFFAGCCYGRPTARPWGVRFTDLASLAPLNVPLHPTQIYESIGDLTLAAILATLLIRHRLEKGHVFWWYLMLYGMLRFGVELFRGDDRGPTFGGLFPSQLIALAAMLLAGSILMARAAERESLHASTIDHHV